MFVGANIHRNICLADLSMPKYLFWGMEHAAYVSYLSPCVLLCFCFILLILFIFWIGDRCTWYKISKVQEFTVKSKFPSLSSLHNVTAISKGNHWTFLHTLIEQLLCARCCSGQWTWNKTDKNPCHQFTFWFPISWNIFSVTQHIAVVKSRVL